MRSKSKNPPYRKPQKSVSLTGVLDQSKKINKSVRQAAVELTEVNEVLKQDGEVSIPVNILKDAVTQNEDVERRLAQAADDLKQVNTELAHEVAERAVIESQLAETRTSLAEAHDDLAVSQANEEESRNSALQDPLTGLANRLSFDQSLDHGLIQARRHGWGLAILFIDIDNFKDINDTHGHDVGDKVLITVAERLRSFVRDEDTVSRWGGDEFVCLLLEVREESDVARLAETMVNRIAEPCEFDENIVSVSVSIGIAIHPADGEMADTLLKNADTAMYKAKGTETRIGLSR